MVKIRHLIVTDSFAGAEQHVCMLANVQARYGHQVEVWGGDREAMRSRLDDAVVAQPCSTVSAALWLARRSGGVDLIHAHMTAAEVAATVAAGLYTRGAAVVATRHFAALRGSSVAGHLVRPVLGRAVAAQIAVSRFVAQSIDGDSTVVYAGVDTPKPELSTRDKVVLVAQRLSPEKRTSDALDIFAASGLAERGWRLEIAGRGAEGEALERRTEQLGLTRSVRLLGFCPDLQARMARAAIVLATAPSEPFGLTVVEAMAHGTPVVAAAGGGHLESVGSSAEAALYPVGDLVEGGRLIRGLAEDPDARTAYGADLRRLQRERFTVDRQYADTQRVYEEVLAR